MATVGEAGKRHEITLGRHEPEYRAAPHGEDGRRARPSLRVRAASQQLRRFITVSGWLRLSAVGS